MSDILNKLAEVLEQRKSADPTTSYVAKLYAKGMDSILKKVGEEATETVLAAKGGNKQEIIYETADLWFHTLVMLAKADLKPQDVLDELARREGLSGIIEKNSRSLGLSDLRTPESPKVEVTNHKLGLGLSSISNPKKSN